MSDAPLIGAAEEKSPDAYRTISEVAAQLVLPQHVLRFWETRFPQIKPLKRAGGRRYYRPEDVAALVAIKARLYDQGYTIKGVQKLIRAHGLAALRDAPDAEAPLFGARVEPTMMAPEPEPTAPKGRAAARPDPGLAAALRAALAELGEARRVLALAVQRP